MTAARAETKDLDQEERTKKMTELNKEMNESTLKAVAEFFKPEQVKRLHAMLLPGPRRAGLRGSGGRQEAEHH